MATPVDKNHKIDIVSQRRHVDYCIQAGAVAVGHFADASEFEKISDTDRTRLLEVCVDQVDGRVPFYAGITGKTSKDIIRYAREAEQKGADMIMTSIPLSTFIFFGGLSTGNRIIVGAIFLPARKISYPTISSPTIPL